MNQRNFLTELKRRNVIRAAILYLGAVWALAQGISQLGPSVGAPDWATRWFLVAAGIGFLFWIAFAWFYEFTPEGLKRESEIDPAESITHHTQRKLDFAIIGVLAVAVVLLLTDRFVLRHGVNEPTAVPISEKSIAVLPFENLSEEKANAFFAVGDGTCWGDGTIALSHSFGEGLLARMTKDEAKARAAFEAARTQQEKIVQAQPDYGPTLCVLGLIDAALGRKDLALDEGRRAIALTPVEKDVKNGSLVLQYFDITAAWAGEKELALQQLETGLRAPAASSMLSYGALKLLPFWDPLRGDPRFEKIVASLAPKEEPKR